ncbi:MAG TPA: hydrogenase [Melioribacteraceae bacterium]|nr:hydrogenase [Melioribacteraceae bacterium]
MEAEYKSQSSHKLIFYGILLFLFGLLTGFLIPALQNPRMGLSSHLEGTMNGMLLVLFGLIWPKLNLSDKTLRWGFVLALYGTFVNWGTTLLAAVWGAGSEMMPIAGADMTGTPFQEILIKFGLISLSVSIVAVSVLILLGLRNKLTLK